MRHPRGATPAARRQTPLPDPGSRRARRLAIALNVTSTPASGTFYVLALFLASRYGFLQRHAIGKAVMLGLLFLASVVVSALLYLSLVIYALLGAVVFVIMYTALWFFAVHRTEQRAHREQEDHRPGTRRTGDRARAARTPRGAGAGR